MARNRLNHEYLFSIVVIALPLMIMIAWIGWYAISVKSGNEVQLRVRGLDPRDLLSGHYLRYRVDYGGSINCEADGPRCLCLEDDGSGIAIMKQQGACSSLVNCDNLLKGTCEKGKFDAGLERFYFPEIHTRKLQVAPADSTIIVSLSPTGKGIVTKFLVGGAPLEEWLRKPTK